MQEQAATLAEAVGVFVLAPSQPAPAHSGPVPRRRAEPMLLQAAA
jgi:hypothetical protein